MLRKKREPTGLLFPRPLLTAFPPFYLVLRFTSLILQYRRRRRLWSLPASWRRGDSQSHRRQANFSDLCRRRYSHHRRADRDRYGVRSNSILSRSVFPFLGVRLGVSRSVALTLSPLSTRRVVPSLSGTSGALYSIFFNGLASGLRSAAESKKSDVATAEVWAEALVQARDTLYQYTRGEQLSSFPPPSSRPKSDSLLSDQLELPLEHSWTLSRLS